MGFFIQSKSLLILMKLIVLNLIMLRDKYVKSGLNIYYDICINICSVVEFQRWWVLKSKLFGQGSTCHQGKIFKKFLRVMTVCQKMGVILESKVVQKLSLEKKVFNK